ncbi:DUF2637 domain-containing protein [Streptomyces sp. NPDC050610]|uniref:DUF2637 domain-containing protein n=1 Tax=Streptomyces sp. NPDC050610 TaxID=3157097 RepID=UPI0034261432
MSGWDRAAIILLGAAGFAFSYDALRQVALAIHARGSLSYLFPVFIDGFIAYGVRALVLLRHSGFGARLYAWFLFLAATGSSLWANSLHAITLNRSPLSGPAPLHLGDGVVGVLSTLAPLALAGSVHLYIIMARTTELSVPDRAVSPLGPVRDGARECRAGDAPGQLERERKGNAPTSELVAVPGLSAADGQDGGSADGPDTSLDEARTTSAVEADEAANDPLLRFHRGWAKGADSQDHSEDGPDGQREPVRPDGESPPAEATASDGPAEESSPVPRAAHGLADEGSVLVPDGGDASEDREVVDQWLAELLPIAREAARQAGRISRDTIKEPVRAHTAISNDRLGELVAALRKEEAEARRPAPAGKSSALW